MEGHQKLTIWQDGIKLTLICYELAEKFPKCEIYGLISQITRAAVSVPANIAEGYGRNTNKEFIQFLYIALGSCNELNTLLVVARDLGYITESDFTSTDELRIGIARRISALISKRKSS